MSYSHSKTGSWWYSVSCATLLFVTAMLKLHAVFSSSALIVDQTDPVFHISNRLLMLIVAIVEVVAGVTLLLNFSQKLNLGLIGWTGLSFLSYHIFSWIVGEASCPCLGKLVTLSPWLDARQSVFIWSIILYLLAGPFWLMPGRKATSSLKNTYKEKIARKNFYKKH